MIFNVQAMKKTIQWTSVVLAVMLTAAVCDRRDDTGPDVQQTILLQAPADKTVWDAATETFPLQFRWSQTPPEMNCRIRFSTVDAFPVEGTVSLDVGSSGEYAATKAQWDEILAGFGVAPGAPIALYWTATPVEGSAETGVRSLTAKRAAPFRFDRTGWTAEATYGKASAANILDGRPDTDWTVPVTEANTNATPRPDPPVEVIIDMKSEMQVDSVTVSTPAAGAGEVYVYLSADRENWSYALKPEGSATMPSYEGTTRTWTRAIYGAVISGRARYVRVRIRTQWGGQPAIRINEVTVAGYDF
jgi:hypothetical protein